MSSNNPISPATRAAVKEVFMGLIPMMQADDFTMEEFELEVDTARAIIVRAFKRHEKAQQKQSDKNAKLTTETPQSDTVVPVDPAIAVLVEAVSDAATPPSLDDELETPARLSKTGKAVK